MKGELQIHRRPRVQRGGLDCPHHYHTSIEEHFDIPNHLDGPDADHRTTARYRAPPRPAIGLPGGAANINPCSVD
jgi:hypothetical protein